MTVSEVWLIENVLKEYFQHFFFILQLFPQIILAEACLQRKVALEEGTFPQIHFLFFKKGKKIPTEPTKTII